uniref:2',3'-cyclic-nucleotide 3'-phosphodiesterase n=1 Tax=Iconisemion striatum TaxID=60296 RepID=A0A1A7XGU5_9TELE
MDTEKIDGVPDVSETQKQEEAVVEKEGKLETTTKESAEPENPPAAVEEAEQLELNGHAAEAGNAEEPVVAENTIQENRDEKVEEKPEASVVAPPESDESSEKMAEPVPEDNPESSHTPELEKPAETKPEEKMSPQPVETQPPCQEEKAPEPVETESQLHTKVETETVKEEPAAVKEREVSPEKPTEAATTQEASAEVVKEAAVEAVVEKQVSSEKPTITEASAEVGSGEPAVGQAEPAVEAVKSEQKESEPQKEEEEVVPAPGSLSFAILEQEETKKALRVSRTLVVLRGLPGSGKSFLARAIADAYIDQCSVFCADSHDIKPENPKASADGYKALDDAVAARCGGDAPASVLVVVDDTNHTHDRLARLEEIAEENNLVAIFLEPQTEWSRDFAELKKKTSRRLEEAQLEAMTSPLEETSIPLFYGWFLLSSVQEKVRCTALDFLKTLDTMDAFKKHMADFSGKSEKEVDLEQYFNERSTFHCTTKFCDYGKADGAKEYSQIPAVKKSYGSVFELSLAALFVTPRTVGAKVVLTEEQLLLWPAEEETQAESASLPRGSRAHITLACAEGIEPVQTGLDLLQILALPQGEVVEEMELGPLKYYGEGRWMLELREPIGAPAIFSSFYAHMEVQSTKKEHEKKKKLKCAIL